MWKRLFNLTDDGHVAASFIGAAAVLAIILAAGAREAPAFFPAEATDIATVAFADTGDGNIVVRSRTGEAVLDPDAHGILGAVTTVLARERRTLGLGDEEPFVLAEDFMGRFAMSDPMTGTQIGLRDYGRQDATAFAALLPAFASPKPTNR